VINEKALDKVRTAKMTGESFAKVAEALDTTLAMTGAAETSMTFDYQHDDIEVVPGDLIPFITIGLRQATLKLPSVDFKNTEEEGEPLPKDPT
jgi:hypothetical protein